MRLLESDSDMLTKKVRRKGECLNHEVGCSNLYRLLNTNYLRAHDMTV